MPHRVQFCHHLADHCQDLAEFWITGQKASNPKLFTPRGVEPRDRAPELIRLGDAEDLWLIRSLVNNVMPRPAAGLGHIYVHFRFHLPRVSAILS